MDVTKAGKSPGRAAALAHLRAARPIAQTQGDQLEKFRWFLKEMVKLVFYQHVLSPVQRSTP